MESHGNLYLSIGSGVTGIVSFTTGYVTTSGIAWTLGVIATAVSITAGLLTIKEKRMSIRHMKKHNKF